MDEPRFFIGVYDQDGRGGLHPLLHDEARQRWDLGKPAAEIRNASFGAWCPRHGLHYFVDEQAGEVAAWRPLPEGWRRLSSAQTRGEAPCFVAVDPDGELLAVANYGSGSVVLFKLDPETGVILSPRRLDTHDGRGPDPDRQDRPHAHCARFHGDFLYATDLGADMVTAVHHRATESEPFVAFKAPAGQGPRHILFHPSRPRAYLLTELGSRVFVLDVSDDGRLVERQSISTLPESFEGDSLGGHLAISGDGARLYASNRGHDSLALFDIGDDGRLTLRQVAPSHGTSPRHFRLVEDRGWILVAHEEDGGVCVLEMAEDGGVGGLLQALPLAKAAFVGTTPG